VCTKGDRRQLSPTHDVKINTFGADVDESRHRGPGAEFDKSRRSGVECCYLGICR